MSKSAASHRITSALVVIVTFVIAVSLMAVYTRNVLRGNINFHFLPAKMWGIPEDLVKKGIQPLYVGGKETGWDGQFYYYIANDLFGLKDTRKHIDAPSYRYQRVGFSALAALAACVTGQDWVSPETFYVTYLLLILVATLFATRLFTAIGIHPLWVLLWSLGVGTQLTLLNALPDAAADSFLIIALTSLYFGRNVTASLMLALAALSREAYVLFPAIISLVQLFNYSHLRIKSTPLITSMLSWLRTDQPWLTAFPIGVFIGWQLYIRMHFGVAPSAEASGVLGAPFSAWYKGLSSGLQGHHILVGPGLPSYTEGFMQIAFIGVLIISAITAFRAIAAHNSANPALFTATALTTLALSSLYICFGPTVANHYTGYMKAATLFFFSTPLLLQLPKSTQGWKPIVLVSLTTIAIFSDAVFWKDRIAVPASTRFAQYTHIYEVTTTEPVACLEDYNATIEVRGFEDLRPKTLLNTLLDSRTQVIWVDVTNNTNEAFTALNGKGSVNMSYHILKEDGKTIVEDGIRTLIPNGIAPGATARVSVVVTLPKKPGRYILRLTPVQEGCAWFYMANPNSAKDLFFELR